MNIEIKDFIKEYKNAVIKIDDIVITKRVTLIYGKNGSGKSTLLKAITGLIKYQGNITKDVRVSYMSEFISLPMGMNLQELIDGIVNLEEYDYELLKKLLNELKLTNKLTSNCESLSKGMAAKVNLLLSLIIDRDLYILDEPLSGLDERSIAFLIKYIKNSKKQFIISSHNLETFKNIVTEVVKL